MQEALASQMRGAIPSIIESLNLLSAKISGASTTGLRNPSTRQSLPDSAFLHLSPSLRSQLSRVGFRMLVRDLCLGLCRLTGAILILLFLEALLDWLFELPVGLRAVFLVLDFAVATGVIYFVVLRIRRPDFEDCALMLERRFPEFQSGLISIVQFSKGVPSPVFNELLKNVEMTASSLPVHEAVSLSSLRRSALGVGVLLLVALLCTAMAWPTSAVLLSRAALASTRLPAETTIISVTSAKSVRAGENLPIEVRASGSLPKSGTLEIARPGAAPVVVSLVPSQDAVGLFTATLPNVQDAFSFKVILKKASSEWYTVEVLQPPSVSNLKMTYHFPTYTGKSPEVVDSSKLELFAGGRLEIEGTATVVLRSARIEVPGKPPLPLKISGSAFQGSIPVPATGMDSLSIVVENAQGVSSIHNTQYAVKIIPDAPPKITWSYGGQERRTVASDFKPRLAFSVSDDYLITGVDLVAKVGPGDPPPVRVPLNIPAPGAAYEFDEILQQPGAFFPWEAGRVVTYWIEARDNNNVTGPGVGKSSMREITIVSREQKRAEIEKRLEQNARRIKDLSDSQKSLRENIGKLLEP